MALSQKRVHIVGESPYPHEQEAIRFAIDALPDTDPYHLWALIDYVDTSTARMYEIDLLIIGFSAIYLVEVKSGPGVYEGDSVDWWRTDDERRRYMDPPLISTNLKSKVIKSRLQAQLRNRKLTPWIEPLVFLSHENTTLKFDPDGVVRVVTRKNFTEAICFGRFPGADGRRRPRISRPQIDACLKGLAAIGFRPRKGKARAGSYELQGILQDGPGYQDRLAVHHQQPKMRRRARTYLVPSQTSVEQRQKLRRAADREAMLLADVREHPNVLHCYDYVDDAPLGPTVLFDSFDGGIPLDAFIRQYPELSFSERTILLEQVARAVHFCHQQGVIHGALTPEAVLVRQISAKQAEQRAHPGGRTKSTIEVRLYNFQLGFSADVNATSHWTTLTADSWLVYQAPELFHDPHGRSPQTDVFSLGAIACFIFTGKPPADTLGDAHEILQRCGYYDPRLIDDAIPDQLAAAIEFATYLRFANRADDVGEWIELLLGELAQSSIEASPNRKRPN